MGAIAVFIAGCLLQVLGERAAAQALRRPLAAWSELSSVKRLAHQLDTWATTQGLQLATGYFDARALRDWLQLPEVQMALEDAQPAQLADMWPGLASCHRGTYIAADESEIRECAAFLFVAATAEAYPGLELLRLVGRIPELQESFSSFVSSYEADFAALSSTLGEWLPYRLDQIQAGITSPAHSVEYRSVIHGIASRTPEFSGRSSDLDWIASHAAHGCPLLIVSGEPWVGKSALLAHLALHPPVGCDVVAYFVRESTGDNHSDGFLGAINSQLLGLARVGGEW